MSPDAELLDILRAATQPIGHAIENARIAVDSKFSIPLHRRYAAEATAANYIHRI